MIEIECIKKKILSKEPVLAGGEVYSEGVINSLKKLKIIARLGVGDDHVDIAAASRAGVFRSSGKE